MHVNYINYDEHFYNHNVFPTENVLNVKSQHFHVEIYDVLVNIHSGVKDITVDLYASQAYRGKILREFKSGISHVT